MGVCCIKQPADEADIRASPKGHRDIIKLFQNNPKLLSTLIRIQSRFRGIRMRNQVKLRAKNLTRQTYDTNFLKNSENEEANPNYKSVIGEKNIPNKIEENMPTHLKSKFNKGIELAEAEEENESVNKSKKENKEVGMEKRSEEDSRREDNEEEIEKKNENLYLKTPKDKLEECFKNYEPLKDNISIELKPPKEIEDRIIYYGEWDPSTNKRHGRGIQIWPDGTKYEGYWVNDKANLKGKLEHKDGNYYEGEWKDDKAEGHGIYYHSDGGKYEGEWKEDKQNGYGVENWPDGSKYEGYYLNGLKHNKGKFEWGDGSFYEGEFDNNNINGKGVYIWSDKRKYEGDWVNNKMEGKGVFNWPDGRVYKGEYKNDKKDGYGEFEWNDGKKYYGEWKEGKQNGKGKFFNPKQNVWKEGIWEKGKRITWLNEKEKS